jgi:hypothetical protein
MGSDLDSVFGLCIAWNVLVNTCTDIMNDAVMFLMIRLNGNLCRD